jgi:hypothetical protein
MKNLLAAIICRVFSVIAFCKRAAPYRGNLKKARRWYKYALEGCTCSDGSPYSVYFKKGTKNKLVISFAGGGMSWNAETAARPDGLRKQILGILGYYFPLVPDYLDMFLAGMLDKKSDPRNPVDDWNFVYLPYASGDFHIGKNDFEYTALDGTPQILHHQGVRNVACALAAIPQEFLQPDQILITGESAGGFGCVAHTAAVAAKFPRCADIAVYVDGSQLQFAQSFWVNTIRDVWKADEQYYRCIDADGQLMVNWIQMTARELGSRVLWLQSHSVFDITLSLFHNIVNHNDPTLTKEALTEYHRGMAAATAILAEIPNYYYYICDHDKNPKTGATSHTTAHWPKRYYDAKVEGISVAQWLDEALNRKKYRNVGKALL